MADGIDLADLFGPAAKLMAKTGAIERLVLSMTEEERSKFFSALSSKLCLTCGKAGNPPSCTHRRSR